MSDVHLALILFIFYSQVYFLRISSLSWRTVKYFANMNFRFRFCSLHSNPIVFISYSLNVQLKKIGLGFLISFTHAIHRNLILNRKCLDIFLDLENIKIRTSQIRIFDNTQFMLISIANIEKRIIKQINLFKIDFIEY